MQQVTSPNGEKGFYDESIGFVKLNDMQRVTSPEGQRGYYHEKIGFVSGKSLVSSNPTTDQVIMGQEAPTPEWAGRNPNLYGLYGAVKELYRTVGKPAIETTGMVGGGILGAGSGFLGGMGLGTIPGAAAGSALGYTGARGVTEGLDQLFDIERTDRNPTIGQRIKSTSKDLALGALGANPKPTIKNITPLVDETILKRFGGQLSPAEITGGKTEAQVEALLEQVPFASDVMQNWREVNQLKPLVAMRNKYLEAGLENTPRGEVLGQKIKEAVDKRLGQFDIAKTQSINDLRDSVLMKLGSKDSTETLSKEAQEVIVKKSAEAVTKKNTLYGAIDDVVPKGELPFINLQNAAQTQLDELSKLPNVDSKLLNTLKWATNTKQAPEEVAFLESISQYPPYVQQQLMEQSGISKVTEVTKDWKTMQSFRNQLTDAIKANDLSIAQGNPALKGQLNDTGRRLKSIQKALDADFEQIAQGSGAEAKQKWDIAQAFYSDEYAPIWKQKTIRNMAYKEPSKVIDIAIKPGSTTEVDLIKKALGDDGFNKTIKPAFTNKILGAGREETFNPAKLQKTLNDYGDETLLKIYSKPELQTLRDISTIGKVFLEKELPNASLLKSLAKIDNGQVLINSILSSVERSPNSTGLLKNISALKNVLNIKEKEGLKLELLDRVFRFNQKTSQVEAGTMAKGIFNYKDTLKLFLSKEEMQGLESISMIGNAMQRAQQMAANPSGTAKNVIAFGASNELIFKPFETAMQGRILDAAGQVVVAGTSKVLGARKLAELYLHPTTRKLLIKGMMTPSNTPKGRTLAKQLSIVIGNEQLSDYKESEQPVEAIQ
jgi:hypothetical protein